MVDDAHPVGFEEPDAMFEGDRRGTGRHRFMHG
jgi:hypothetical protein